MNLRVNLGVNGCVPAAPVQLQMLKNSQENVHRGWRSGGSAVTGVGGKVLLVFSKRVWCRVKECLGLDDGAVPLFPLSRTQSTNNC